MQASYQKRVTQLAVEMDLVTSEQLAPHLTQSETPLSLRLLESGVLPRAQLEQLYQQLAKQNLQAKPHYLQRATDIAMLQLALDEKLLLDGEGTRLLGLLTGADSYRPLIELLDESHPLLADEAQARLEQQFEARFFLCLICAQVVDRTELDPASACPRCGVPIDTEVGEQTILDTNRAPPCSEQQSLDGKTIGQTRLIRKLGQGGMGTVYLAHHIPLDREVAVKILPPMLSMQSEWRERFLQECRLAARLEHPNVVRVFDSSSDQGTYYLVMEYVPGQSLSARLADEGPLPLAEALDVARQAALALIAAHKQGLIHRDIKPDNLMQTPDGTIKVADFGLARDMIGSGLSITGQILGTPTFMSPEQANGESVDHRTDIYSLGMTLYVLLSGKPPFARNKALATLRAVTDAPLPPLRSVVAEAPVSLGRLVSSMCAKQRHKRPTAMSAVLDELDQIIRELTGPASGAQPAELRTDGSRRLSRASSSRLRKSRDSNRRSRIVAAIVGLLMIIGGAFALRSSSPPDREKTPPEKVSPDNSRPAKTRKSTPAPKRTAPVASPYVLYDNLPEGWIRNLPGLLEAAYAHLQRRLGDPVQPPPRLEVYLYDNQAELASHYQRLSGEKTTSSVLYWPETGAVLVSRHQAHRYRTRQWILYSLCLQYLWRLKMGNRKRFLDWACLGLAESFGHHEWDGKELRTDLWDVVSAFNETALLRHALAQENSFAAIVRGEKRPTNPLSFGMVQYLAQSHPKAWGRYLARLLEAPPKTARTALDLFIEQLGQPEALADQFARTWSGRKRRWLIRWFNWDRAAGRLVGWSKTSALLLRQLPAEVAGQVRLELRSHPENRRGMIFGWSQKRFEYLELWGDKRFRLQSYNQGRKDRWQTVAEGSAPASKGAWRTLLVSWSRNHVEVKLDGRPLLRHTYKKPIPAGNWGLYVVDGRGEFRVAKEH